MLAGGSSMELYANLHIHSTHSDGGYSPSKIVQVCKEEGYHALAITDHDVATAYPELKANENFSANNLFANSIVFPIFF